MTASELPFDPDQDALVCVVGPTASQKTELAIRICERVDGEVVGADSVQVYTRFDLGSGKPTPEELARARHHLVDFRDPREPLDAATFAKLAQAAVDDIRSRGRVPVVCGGTFLWVRALVHGLADAPPAVPALRQRLEREAAAIGVPALHARLARVDSPTAAKLSENDFVRIQRALEVYELSGRRLSDLHWEHQQRGTRHRAHYVGIHWSHEQLEARIRRRAEQWLENGWIDEVARLLDEGLRNTRPMASVGYRQVVEYLDGEVGREDLLVRVVRATKVFARRQRTWLRDEPVVWQKPP